MLLKYGDVMNKKYSVSGIGNAMVDTLSEVDESFLLEHKIQKGIMQLIDSNQSVKLLQKLGSSKKVAGGSAANTIVALSNLNISTAYFGKVADDLFGRFFVNDLKERNVFYDMALEKSRMGLSTGSCLVLITSDGERSMNTHLGATEFLSLDDINLKVLQETEWLYLEGYRFDGDKSQLAFNESVRQVKKYGGNVALTLSDPFCVERHREKFERLITNGVDVIFCNAAELVAYTEKKSLEEALDFCTSQSPLFVCTAGPEGAFVCDSGAVKHIKTRKLKVLDATGAGDFFAAGFLSGLVAKVDLETSAHYGNIAAGVIIQQVGTRFTGDLLSIINNNDNL